MSIITPFWFAQRQGEAEAKGEHTYELTAPNLVPALILIRQGAAGQWAAILRPVDDEPAIDATEERFDRPEEAWEAAFEMFRLHRVV